MLVPLFFLFCLLALSFFSVAAVAGVVTALIVCASAGPIPTQIGQLENLTQIWVAGNRLTGAPTARVFGCGQLASLPSAAIESSRVCVGVAARNPCAECSSCRGRLPLCCAMCYVRGCAVSVPLFVCVATQGVRGCAVSVPLFVCVATQGVRGCAGSLCASLCVCGHSGRAWVRRLSLCLSLCVWPLRACVGALPLSVPLFVCAANTLSGRIPTELAQLAHLKALVLVHGGQIAEISAQKAFENTLTGA